MEERGPIQLLPPGLLGLLQLKVAGAGVSKLGDTCLPSMDMLEWWLRATAQLWTTNSGVTVAAGFVGVFTPFSPNAITVPAGEWWYVHDYTCEVQVPGGESYAGLRLAWASTSSGTIYFGALEDSAASTSTNGGGASAQRKLLSSGGFWLPPGARLGFWIDLVVGAGGTFVVCRQLRYTRCPS